jgi:4'-phosphopantetheinyl transferase
MRLHAGALHVWQADLDAIEGAVEMVLSNRERERAARIVREPTRRRWTVARGVLRVILGEYLQEDPNALRFAEEPHGKPMLSFPSGTQLRFNLSHSGGLAVYALSVTSAVGVDVELVGRGSTTSAHHRDFLRAWVRHEAEAKRLGLGLKGMGFARRASGPRPWIAALDLGPTAEGAVALANTPVDFQVYPVDFRSYGSILPTGTIKPTRYESNVST